MNEKTRLELTEIMNADRMKYSLKYSSDVESINEYLRRIIELVKDFAQDEAEVLKEIRKEFTLKEWKRDAGGLRSAQERIQRYVKRILDNQ